MLRAFYSRLDGLRFPHMTKEIDSGGSEDFASLLAEYEAAQGGGGKKRRKDPQPGEEVRGRVISIGRDSAFVDIGTKSDAVIDLAELRDADGKVTVQVGDELEARVVEATRDGSIVLRRLVGRGRGESAVEVEQAWQAGLPVEGLVSGVATGKGDGDKAARRPVGLEVQIAGVRAFCPASQVDLRPVDDLTPFVGQRLTFRITKLERGPRGLDLVLSRRALLEEEQAAQASETRRHLAIGAVMRGRVTAVKDFGAFVDLGGLEGMIHVSELGWDRTRKVADILSVNQEVEVVVLRVEKTDDPKRPERIALSLKALERDPWADAKERFPEGARVAGVVVRVEAFGAFVEVAPGVEGLVHISELGAKKRVRHAKEVVKPGQRVEVVVLDVDVDRRRLSLALADEPTDGDDAGGAPSSGKQEKSGFGTFADLLKKK
jgi:small subunit ribosomal protein S1